MAHSIGQLTTFSSSNPVDSIHAHSAMTIFGRRCWRVPVGSARPSGPPVNTAYHTKILYLAEYGEYQRAAELLLESGLGKAFQDQPLNYLRLRWVEGMIQAGLGQLDRADVARRLLRPAPRLRRRFRRPRPCRRLGSPRAGCGDRSSRRRDAGNLSSDGDPGRGLGRSRLLGLGL